MFIYVSNLSFFFIRKFDSSLRDLGCVPKFIASAENVYVIEIYWNI